MRPSKIARHFHMPTDEQLRELGRVVVQNSYLDLMLSRTIKMIEGLTEAEANQQLGGMASSQLRKLAETCARKKLGGSSAAALASFVKLLEKAKAVSESRNLYAHGHWKNRDGQLSLLDLRHLKDEPLPTVKALRQLADAIRGVAEEIDEARLRPRGFLYVALQAKVTTG